ncbi:MAG TPA: hypothetical protein VM935_01560, partial [Chitinophagaceae bacterium]|nr:hypothetical protein [Chitinophagaceae bacterium]
MNKKEDEVKPSAGEESLKPPVTSAIQPAVHLDSKLKITDSYSYDLDEGTIEDLEKSGGIDFFWRRPTSMEYELVPDLGKFVLLGKIDFDQLSLESLQKLEYSKNPINSDLLIKGAVVGIITKANR